MMASNTGHAEPQPVVFPDYPFKLGVASGDPLQGGVVLWTKLATEPLAADGHGGIPPVPIPVRWEVAEDERFRRVVARGVEQTGPNLGHSVHAEVSGLRPERSYFYRFRVGSEISPVGRTRTAPAAHNQPATLRFAQASCQHVPHGFYTAYQHMAQQDLDLVVFLGDYIYEGPAQGSLGRGHQPPIEISALAEYRVRYGQYRSEPELQAVHASFPWLVVWDDHELDSDWADEVPSDGQPIADFLRRRAAAFQVYYEFMPLRSTSIARGIDLQLFRRIHWGRLATFHLLDTRQYRDAQVCGGGFADCPEAFDPARSILGADQESWLIDGFQRSRARWDILAQQVVFARRLVEREGILTTRMDAWDGYVASQERITEGWIDAGVRNPIVLSGDVHAHWATDLKLDYLDPAAETVGSELVTTSITTDGNGEDSFGDHPIFADNPHLRFYTNLRGYVTITVTPEHLAADLQCVRRVTEPGAEVFTRASFVVDDGVRGLRQTLDRPPTPDEARRLPDRTREEAIRALIAKETADP
ncbi:alkaline phosphatase D family protein [Actinopolymorpha sp. B17G11]|uniref:alkaline phosphatase D family protein n=1 Tax=Actinopolymorpha sp. B17G11 TaxID=3160861 RepID=UPI0032E3C4C5